MHKEDSQIFCPYQIALIFPFYRYCSQNCPLKSLFFPLFSLTVCQFLQFHKRLKDFNLIFLLKLTISLISSISTLNSPKCYCLYNYMAPNSKKQAEPKYKTGEVLAWVSDGQFGLCQVQKDVPKTANTITAKILILKSPLRYEADHNGTVKVSDVVANVAFTKEGNFIKITKKVKTELDKLIPPKEESEDGQETEEEAGDEYTQQAVMTQAAPKVASRHSSPSPPKRPVALTQQPKKRPPPKNPRQGRANAKPKRGKPNPNIPIVTETPELTDKSSKFLLNCCSICANRNLHRAAFTGNLKLLKTVLASEHQISALSMRWGPEAHWTPVELMAAAGQEKLLEQFVLALKNEKLKLAPFPPCAITSVNTGQVAFEAFGARVRAVKMSRGGREGSNAFVYSLFHRLQIYSGPTCLTNYLHRIIKRGSANHVQLLEKLFVAFPDAENVLVNCIGDAVRSGNQQTALWLIKLANKKGGYGFNKLHEEVLSTGKLSDFKKVSITKKTMGNYSVAPLHCAAICQKPDHLNQLLSMVDDIHYADLEGRKVVHYAAANKSAECLKLVLAAGGRSSDADKNKITPLMLAAKYNSAACCDMLLRNGAIIDAKNKKKLAAIHYAAKYGCLDALGSLLEFRTPKTLDLPGVDSMTPLMYAASRGHLDAVTFLLDNGAKVLKRDKMKRSALAMACRNGHLPVVSLLLARGADPEDPDSSKNYPIHYACAYGWQDCIDFLVSNGANINALNDWKFPPLLICLLKGHFGCMRKVLEYENVDVNCKDEDGRTLLSRALDLLNEQSIAEIEFLLGNKAADPNLADLKGRTPLHHLAMKPKPVAPGTVLIAEERREWVEKQWDLQVKTVHMLLKYGANINALTRDDETPLLLAIRTGNERVSRELLALNAEIMHISKSNSSILHEIASFSGDLHSIASDLLDRPDVIRTCLNLINDDGLTPLLKYMQIYADQAPQVFLTIREQVLTEETARLQGETGIQLNQQPLNGAVTSLSQLRVSQPFPGSQVSMAAWQGDEEEDMAGGLKGGARTRMTARTYRNPYAAMNASAPLNLDDSKVNSIARERFQAVVSDFLRIISKLVSQGENAQVSVEKLKKYKIDPELITKEYEESKLNPQNMYNPPAEDRFFITDTDGMKIWNEYGPHGKKTALHLAAEFPNEELLTYLLKETSVDVDARDYTGRTAISLLIEKNADRNLIKTVLSSSNLNVNICDCQGQSPLYKAVQLRKTDVALELLTTGKAYAETLTRSGDFPLKLAVAQKDLETIGILLNCGADPNFSDHKKRTALHLAFNHADTSANASFDIETLLLEAGANINALDIRNRLPLHYAFVKIGHPVDNSGIDPIETISSALGQKGVQTAVRDSWGRTPLHYAAQRGSVTSALLLLGAGCELDMKDDQGNTPLCTAIMSNHADFAIMLIQKGANVHETVHILQRKHKKPRAGLEAGRIDLQDYSYNVYGQRNPAQTGTNTSLPLGSFSLFRCAVKLQWQGVAYLLLTSGYDYMLALQDAMVEGKFALVLTLLSKVAEDSVVQKTNEQMQNLLHIFGLYGAGAEAKLAQSIGAKLKLRGINISAKDSAGCVPLHYACKTHFIGLISFLRNLKAAETVTDKAGKPPIIYAIEGSNVVTSLTTLVAMEGVSLNVRFTTERNVTTTILIHAICMDAPKELLTYLLDRKLDVKEVDSKGKTVLMHAICRNNQALVEKIISEVPVNATDKKGRTAVHYAVRPFKLGSYENLFILELLAKRKANLNQKDTKGKTPLHFACLQKSGFMRDHLIELGAKVVNLPEVRETHYRAVSPPDYISDAESYIRQQQAVEEIHELPAGPDPVGHFQDYFRVVPPFDLLMCRVDVAHGPYSAYLFYRMQLLEDTNRGVYVVYTRWGRIGEDGANQRTPFGDLAEATKEFSKIYKQKTGNEWGQTFEFVKGKYRLMELSGRRVEFKDFLKGIDAVDIERAVSPKEVVEAMKHLSELKVYAYAFHNTGIDEKVLNFSNISLKNLDEAEELLRKIGELIPILQTSKNTDEMLTTKDQISDLSSRYYEIIPQKAYLHTLVPPIQHPNALKAAMDLIDSLRNIELASQLILGALYRREEMHPLDYCYRSLRCEMVPLAKDSDESHLIEQYARSGGCANKIEAIFSISREGESERCQKWSLERHKMLLWHGSAISNFFGILRNGLKIAPPEAPPTGYMFGKGVYFADTFSKSFQYTGGFSDRAFMLLSEVVLGKMYLRYQSEYVEKLPEGYLSTKGCGQNGPDMGKCIVLNSGAVVPLGPIVQYPPPDTPEKTYYLHQNEYIVYDISQVRLRYLVEVKTQAEDQLG